MGKELVEIKTARPAVSVDLSRINYSATKAAIEKYIGAVGGGSRSGPKFPGDQITFKTGEWMRGFGDKGKKIKPGTDFVLNLPNMMAGWLKWTENDAGKRYPMYSDMCCPAAGDDMVLREALGDLDESEWEVDDSGRAQDPWRAIVVIPVRTDGDETVHHVMLTAKSAVIAGFNLFRDVIEDMKLHPNELPLVTLGADKAKREFEQDDPKKPGKKKKVVQVWDVPTFEVSGWADATDADNPPKGGVEVKKDIDEDDGDVGEVKSISRTPAKAPKPEPKPVAKGKAKIKAPADDDEDL
jgi:hypothetical protein